MQTKIDLCSMALLKLGEQPIQSLTADSPAAQLARTLFDSVTDTLLAMHPWKFACSKTELHKTDNGDFIIPTDCLRIVKCDGEIIGDKIISPAHKIIITAIMRKPPESFPGYFVSLLTTKLAMEFCIPLTADQTVFRMLAALYETEMQSAKFIDSTMSTTHNGIDNFSLVSARF